MKKLELKKLINAILDRHERALTTEERSGFYSWWDKTYNGEFSDLIDLCKFDIDLGRLETIKTYDQIYTKRMEEFKEKFSLNTIEHLKSRVKECNLRDLAS